MIKGFFSILIFLIVIYLLGTIVLYICRIKKPADFFSDVFNRSIIGLTIIVAAYSLIITKGVSISLGFLLAAVFALLYMKRNNLIKKQPFTDYLKYKDEDYVCMAVIALSVIVFFFFRTIFFYNSPYNNEVHFDYFFYSALGDCMVQRGVETTACVKDLFCESNVTSSPYHYFDIWFVMALTKLFGITSVESLFVETFVIFGVLAIIGLVALTRQYTKNSILQILAPSALLLTAMVTKDTSIGLNIFSFWKRLAFVPQFPLTNTKHICLFVYFLWSVLLYKKSRELSFILLCTLPLLNIVLTPSFYCGIAVGVVFLFLTKNNKVNTSIVLVTLCSLSIFILLFYFGRTNGESSVGDFSVAYVKDNLHNNFSYIVKSIIKFPFFFILYYLPVLGLFLYVFKKNKNGAFVVLHLLPFLLFVFISIVVGYILMLFFDGNYDSFQFLYLPAMILLIVYWLSVIIAITYIKSSVIVSSVYIIYFCFIPVCLSAKYIQTGAKGSYYDMNNSQDVSYLQSIEEHIKNKKSNPIGVSIQNMYTDVLPYRTYLGFPYQFCPQIPGLNLKTVSISTLKPISPGFDSPQVINRQQESPFYKFAEQYQKTYGRTSADSLQLSYVKKNHVGYAIVCAGQSLPKIFVPYIDTVFYRPNSTEQFVFFKEVK